MGLNENIEVFTEVSSIKVHTGFCHYHHHHHYILSIFV
jgi:hypothetical protein